MPPSHRTRPRLLLLGPVQVTRDGTALPIRGHKQHLLLARLALAGGKPVSADALVDALWESDPPTEAGRALQVHISRLRSALGVGIELVNGAAYRLEPGALDTDLDQFLRLCEEGRAAGAGGDRATAVSTFDRALGLWRGPALGELGESNALRADALQLADGRNRAIDDWVQACLDTGRADDVIGELRSSLDQDPLQENRWRQLILALHRCGRHGEALDAHHRVREVFIDELGVEPTRLLGDVHAELQRLDRADPTSTNPPSTNPASNVPGDRHHAEPDAVAPSGSGLIGRSDEYQRLRRAWHDASTSLRVITISGEAGVGKSRLTSEFAAAVSTRGGRVLTGRCDPAISSAFQPFAQMLLAHFDERLSRPGHHTVDPRLARHLPGLLRVAPELVEVLPAETNRASAAHIDGGGHATFDAVTAWLSILSESAPALLVIDDLHWADTETLGQLRHLLHSPRSMRVLVVVALRDREMGSGPDTEPSGSALVTELLRQSDRVNHVPLGRLDRDETAALLTAEASGPTPPSREVIEHVRTASGGNPLFVVELARQLRSSSSSNTAPTVTPGLRHVISGRVALLPRPTRTLLGWASALGTVFDAAVLVRLAELAGQRGFGTGDDDNDDNDDTAAITVADVGVMAAEAVHAQLIEPAGGGSGERYAFSHDIVRTTLYGAMPPRERSALHGLVAEVLEGRPAGDATAHHSTLARHLRRSDLPDAATRAARHLLEAGRDALGRGASENALRLLHRASGMVDGDSALRCDLLTELGAAQFRCARPEHRQTLLEAARLARELGDRDRLIAAVLANSRGWWSSTMEIDHERVAGIEMALAMCDPDDAAVRAPLLATWAMENVRDPGSRDEVLSASAEALRLAEQYCDEAALTMALARRYTALYTLFEQPAECLRLGERLSGLARRSGDRMTRLTASVCMAQASMRFGQFHVADRHMQQAAQLARTLEQPAREWLVAGWQATRVGMRGDLNRAEELVRENLELGLRTEQGDATTWFIGQLFAIRLLQGRLPEMLADVDDQVVTVAGAIPAWRAAMAVVLAQVGATADAEAVLEDLAADSFSALPRDMIWLNGMTCLCLVCESVGRADIAERLYLALAPYSGMVATNGTIDTGPVDLHLGALARMYGDADLAGQHLKSAVALCRRIDAPVWGDRAAELLLRL